MFQSVCVFQIKGTEGGKEGANGSREKSEGGEGGRGGEDEGRKQEGSQEEEMEYSSQRMEMGISAKHIHETCWIFINCVHTWLSLLVLSVN